MAQLQMSVALVAICLMAANVFGRNVHPAPRDDPDEHLTTPELISKYGYPSETHEVTTDDGYILTLHRIPYGKGLPSDVKRTPILVQHGLMSSSADWVIMGPGIAFAYVLADAGYDVWLGNARGHTYSRQHQTLDPNSQDFWQFSWHEMGVHDVPAFIDYILKETGQEKLFYAGHSMGTTMFYVMGSELPQYNDKILSMFSLAPIAYMSHMKSPLIKLIADFEPALDPLLELMGGFEFLPHSELLTMLGADLCNEQAPTVEVCTNVIFLVCGFDSQELDEEKLPAILGHVPAGGSTMEYLHYGQEVTSGKFRQYDHGAIDNMIKYGQLEPPEYDLSKVTAPVYLHWSGNDWLSAQEDVNELNSELGNSQGMFKVSLDAFNHLDYLWAKDGPSIIYNKVVDEMQAIQA